LSNAESSKNLAAIGAILLFLSFIPVVGIIGIILVLVGMKGLAEHYKDDSIYRNAIRGVIFGVIGIIAMSVGLVAVFFASMVSTVIVGPVGVIGGILSLILILVVAFVFYLFMAMYFKRSFDSLSERSGEQLFHTAGTLLLWGAVLTIIGIGLILIFLAWIIATIGFFSIKVPQSYSYVPPQTAAPTMQVTRFCPNCGAPEDPNSTFCPHCGKQLPPP